MKRAEKLQSRKKLLSEEQAMQKFLTEERRRRGKARDYLQPWWRKRKVSLRWVPKHSIIAEEGTSVPEAVEIEIERGLDYGESEVLSSSSWTNMSAHEE